MTRFASTVLLGCLLLAAATRTAVADDKKPVPLVVVVVIDQFRGDYLDAFRSNFCDDGFQRLIRDGAWMANAHYEYGMTATGPGHASLLTGSTPATHGIVANDWEEFASQAHGVYCCGDDSVRCVGLPDGGDGAGRSPANLRAQTLGEAVKAATGGHGKVWSVALKDRAAILTAGHKPNGAVWFDAGSGNLVTSSYYGTSLPAWAQAFNQERYADKFFKTKWDRMLPAALYGPHFLKAPGGSGEDRRHRNEFPKILGEKSDSPDREYYAALYNSPFGNEIVLEAARRVITTEGLGTDDATDVLCMGFSSNDVVGHAYGPDSDEVMDCTLHTDRQLADFFNWLDGRLGNGNYVLVLSSDHGVGPMPEYAADLGLGAGRIDPGKMRKAINAQLAERYASSEGADKLVIDLNLPWLYLDEAAIKTAGLDLAEVAQAAARMAEQEKGIVRAFTFPEIAGFSLDDPNELQRAVRNSYFPGRSGHVYLHWERYWYKGSKQAGHGAAYDYDQHVPVLMMGPGVAPGRFTRAVSPTGMVPTVCAVLGIAPPATATGEVYSEIARVAAN